MIKKNDLHEGLWGLFTRFGLNAANASVDFGNVALVRPVAFVPLVEIGLQEVTQLNDLSLDAAVVNPRQKAAKKAGKARKKGKK